MYDVSFTLIYAIVDLLKFQMVKFLPVLLTFTETEASDRKWKKISLSVLVPRHFEVHMHFNVNDAITAM